jgi:superoxide dismutase
MVDGDLGGGAAAEAFTAAATARFGSGWAWLVADRGTLKS